MKYLLSGLFFFLSFSFATSQNILDYKEYYIGTGYSVGVRNFGALNQILDKYNDNNIQEKKFGDWKAPNGISFLAGTTQSFFNVEFGFSQIQQRKKTTFNDNEDLYRRDARLRINSYYLGVGVFSHKLYDALPIFVEFVWYQAVFFHFSCSRYFLWNYA